MIWNLRGGILVLLSHFGSVGSQKTSQCLISGHGLLCPDFKSPSIHYGPTGGLSCLSSFCLLLGFPGWPSWTGSKLHEVLRRNGIQLSVLIHGVSLVLCRVVSLTRTPPTAQQELLCYEMLRALPGKMEFTKQKLTMRAMSKFLQVFVSPNNKSSQEANPAVSAGQPTAKAARVGNCLAILALERQRQKGSSLSRIIKP